MNSKGSFVIMTLRTRLMLIIVAGLIVTMALWGWIQLRALDKILVDQQIQRLSNVAETVSTFYQNFPTRRGLSALDRALKDHIHSDIRLARIDLFSINHNPDDIQYIAGAGRVAYDWPETTVVDAAEKIKPQYIKISTEAGPALGFLYPILSENKKRANTLVGVIVFTQFHTAVLSKAQRLLMISTSGLLLVILLVLTLSYQWLIGRPLNIITHTIDEFRKGQYLKRIPLVRADEWGNLAHHFNSMADEIERVLARNQELNRHLSQRVQEETHKVIQLQLQVNQLQKLTALGYLTATLAHDMGTPLHSIAGLAKLVLESEGLPADISRKLDLIIHQTQRLNAVIQNVRRATRLPEPHIEATSVSDLLHETRTLVEPLIKSNIEMNVHIEPHIALFYCDRNRVQTALFNLIQNAAEAMPDGGKITMTAYADLQRRSIAISIQDTGTGMPPELLARVCEPFFTTHTEEGLRGLGLAIVQDIIKAHGGHFDITSTPQEGTKVVLYFNIVENPSVEQTKS